MFCKHFGICGSCKFDNYEEQLNFKIAKTKERFNTFFSEFDIFHSKDRDFRSRVEFRIRRDENGILKYAMFTKEKRFFYIDECTIIDSKISDIFIELLDSINLDSILKERLYAIEFLTGEELLVTLIYHKKLDNIWVERAKIIENKFSIHIIGRSKNQKLNVSQDFINTSIKMDIKEIKYQFVEGSFTQPNSYMNQNMINWVLAKTQESKRDLLELYCGAGNFTLPLSYKFRTVLATEINKTSMNSLANNLKINDISNIYFARLSSEELTEALNKTREFFRLKDIDLESFDFETLFVDPPRAGLDEKTREFAKKFDKLIYISCNQESLKRDLEFLLETHKIDSFAIFDQFPYSEHIESGVILTKSI